MTMPYEGVVYEDQEDMLKRYRARIEAATNSQKPWFDQSDIFLSYYRNAPKVYTKGGQKVRVPVAISSIDAMFSALTAVEVEIKISPLATTDPAQAEVAEEGLRNEWLTQKVQQEVEYATKDSLCTGLGWVFVGYEYESEEVDRAEADIRSEAQERIQQTVDEGGEYPDPDQLATEISSKEEVTLKDRVFVEHVAWDDILWDPEAGKWPDVRWVSRKFVLPWEQVREDPQYDNTEDLGWDTAINEKWRMSKAEAPADDEKRVTLHEMWDFETGKVCTFAEEGDKLLREDPNPFAFHDDYQDRSPFVPLILRSNPGKVHGIGDIEAMKPSIDEQNVLRSSLATYVERMKPKVIAKEGSFSQAGKRALKSQEWGEVVETTPQTQVQDVRPFDLPTLPQEAFMQDQKAAEDARNAIGLNELLQGILPVGKKTATGMGILQNASEIRQSERKNRMERFYTDIAQRMLNIMQQFYDKPRITKLVGDREDVVWTWTGDDLTMVSSVEISLQPKQAVDDQTLRENMLMLKNIMGVDPNIDQAELNKYILKQMKIPKDWIKKLLKQPEQQQAEAMGQAQQASVMAEAEQGLPPDPAMVPGPMDGGETLSMANPGQIPTGPLERLSE